MAVAAVSADALERLGRLETAGPVLSVYLDLDPSRFPTPAARDAELSALLSRAGARDLDARRVRDAVKTHPDLTHGAQSVAIFSCAEAGALEVLALPEPVEPLVVVDTVPWLEPLAAMITAEDWGVAVVSRRAARLFRGGRRVSSSSHRSRTSCIDATRRGGGRRRASSAGSSSRSPSTCATPPSCCCAHTGVVRSTSSRSSAPPSSHLPSRPSWIASCAIVSPG